MQATQQKTGLRGLLISTIAILILFIAQGWSGNWASFYLIWPGSNPGATFLQVVSWLDLYHIKTGFAIGGLAVLVVVLAFISRSNLYIRIFAILGLVITVLAVTGGFIFVNSAYQDRLSLGQMADSFIGAFTAYFLMLFFMFYNPRFPWSRKK
jgi:hypothetical protein